MGFSAEDFMELLRITVEIRVLTRVAGKCIHILAKAPCYVFVTSSMLLSVNRVSINNAGFFYERHTPLPAICPTSLVMNMVGTNYCHA